MLLRARNGQCVTDKRGGRRTCPLVGDEVLIDEILLGHVGAGSKVAPGFAVGIPLELVVVVGAGALQRAGVGSIRVNPILTVALLLHTAHHKKENQKLPRHTTTSISV